MSAFSPMLIASAWAYNLKKSLSIRRDALEPVVRLGLHGGPHADRAKWSNVSWSNAKWSNAGDSKVERVGAHVDA